MSSVDSNASCRIRLFKQRLAAVFIHAEKEEAVTQETLLPQINEGLGLETLFGLTEASTILQRMDGDGEIFFSEGGESSFKASSGSLLTSHLPQLSIRSRGPQELVSCNAVPSNAHAVSYYALTPPSRQLSRLSVCGVHCGAVIIFCGQV